MSLMQMEKLQENLFMEIFQNWEPSRKQYYHYSGLSTFPNTGNPLMLFAKHIHRITFCALLYLCQIFMYKAYRHRTFTDGGRHTIHGACAHISCCKNSGTTCFQ